MNHLLNNLYFQKIKSEKLDDLFKRSIIRIANFLLPIYFYLTKGLAKNRIQTTNLSQESKITIVSLTTFPSRIGKVWLTIETILRQNDKPNKILLWLYKDEFEGKESLPKQLLHLEKRGLEIRFCDENLMPHKKYYYSMLEYPEADIITIDDDMFYPPDLLSKLKINSKKFPNDIICTAAREIKIKNSKPESYDKWPYLKNNSLPLYSNLAIGVGGTLFPSHSLHPDLFNVADLKRLALKTDDLWLKIMSLKNQTKVASLAGEYSRFHIPIIQKSNSRLMDLNIREGQNDIVFKELLDYYQIPVTIFED